MYGMFHTFLAWQDTEKRKVIPWSVLLTEKNSLVLLRYLLICRKCGPCKECIVFNVTLYIIRLIYSISESNNIEEGSSSEKKCTLLPSLHKMWFRSNKQFAKNKTKFRERIYRYLQVTTHYFYLFENNTLVTYLICTFFI